MASKIGRAAKTATDAMKILWAEGYFRSWRRKGATEEHLARRGNHFSNAELTMALKRARHLTRRGNRGAYEYIQKFPAGAEAAPARAGRKGKDEPK